MMARPNSNKNRSLIHFHLREVCSVSLTKYDETLWLFGNTVDKSSVAIRVDGFRPYFFLECPDDLGSLEAWCCIMNQDLAPWENAPDVITRVDIVERVPVIGYCDSKKQKLLKVEYLNQSYIQRLIKHFSKPVHVGLKPRILKRYHDDWGVVSLFLHESGLKMQEWVKVTAYPIDNIKITSCNIERKSDFGNFHWTESLSSIPPLLCCAIRIRARSAMSTQMNPIVPKADNKKDTVSAICIQIYWMEDEAKQWNFTFNDENESKLLHQFEKVVNDFDIDCFQYLSDNCDPLRYIATRNTKLALSKFRNLGSKLLIRSIDKQVYKCLIPGRSSMNIQCVLKKMQIEPRLDGFTLKDAIFHPDIIRANPDIKMMQHSFILGNFLKADVLSLECEQEVDYIRQVDQNNSMLLGFVEISAASCTQLTVAVENGQQIRVWKKFISKFHERNLFVNRQLLDRPPIIVNKKVSESDYSDPPEYSNVPFTERKSQLQQSKKRFRDFSGAIVDLEKKQKKAKVKRYQGGYVCDPESGFYSIMEESTFTFDFGSLYPSIIDGNQVCYMRLLYDRQLLDDDRYKKEFVPVNESECIVLVLGKYVDGVLSPAETIVPHIISEVCQERNRVKKLMKSTSDPFLYASLNAKQLGCKVFQNAVYGFLGVARSPLLACPVLMAMVCRIGQNMIKQVRHMMLKDHQAYVVYGDTDSVMVQFPHPENLETKDEIFGYYYELCTRLAILGTDLFPSPNKLNFESMKFPYWLRKKKNYAALEYSDKTWKETPKLVIKGLPFKKRDRCTMVRRVGYQVMQYILTLQSDKIQEYLKKEMQSLIRNKIPYEQLAITCLLQDESEYKVDNLIQLETARNISARNGSFFEPGSRLSYVVVHGSKPLYQRGEDPIYAQENSIKLDLIYYLEKQLLSAILPLLEFHDDINITHDVIAIKQEIKRKSSGVSSLDSMLKKRKRSQIS
jgi:DNA polymerase elongation subunit (family B)